MILQHTKLQGRFFLDMHFQVGTSTSGLKVLAQSKELALL